MVEAGERTLANSPFRKATCQSGRSRDSRGSRGSHRATAGHRESGVGGTLPREIHLYVVLDPVLDAHVHSPPPPERDGAYAHGMIARRYLDDDRRHSPKSTIHIHLHLSLTTSIPARQ